MQLVESWLCGRDYKIGGIWPHHWLKLHDHHCISRQKMAVASSRIAPLIGNGGYYLHGNRQSDVYRWLTVVVQIQVHYRPSRASKLSLYTWSTSVLVRQRFIHRRLHLSALRDKWYRFAYSMDRIPTDANRWGQQLKSWCVTNRKRGAEADAFVIYLSVFQGVSVICRYCDRKRVGLL